MIQIRCYWKSFFCCSLALLSSLQADWSLSPTTLDALTAPANASSQASFVVDNLGNITATWLENADGGTVVQAAYYSINSNLWTNPTVLDLLHAATIAPQLVVDSSDVVTAVWIEYEGGNYLVQTARFSDGIWTPPTTLNSGSTDPSVSPPLVVVDSSGNVTVVWFETSSNAIQAARFSAGFWTDPVSLDGDSPNVSTEMTPQMVVDVLGNVTVAWVENLGSSSAVEAARFSQGAWGLPATILDNGTQMPNACVFTSEALQMSVDPYGNVTVGWLENSMYPLAVQVARFTLGGLAPPENLRGAQQVNRFLAQKDYVNVLSWNVPSVGVLPTSYRIYRDSSLTQLAGVVNYEGNPELQFFDHNRNKGQPYSYYICSVYSLGNQSTPASIVVP